MPNRERDTNEAIHSLAKVLSTAEEITSVDDLENNLLEVTQQAQEVIILIEEGDYVQARERFEEVESKFNAVKQYIDSLVKGNAGTDSDDSDD